VYEGVIGDEGNGQMHAHQHRYRPSGLTLLQDREIVQQQQKSHATASRKKSHLGADEVRATMGQAMQAMMTPITVSFE